MKHWLRQFPDIEPLTSIMKDYQARGYLFEYEIWRLLEVSGYIVGNIGKHPIILKPDLIFWDSL